ncbi:hypothetical protein HII31_07938 [Pseudocercospora fuligena]|uniref:F-box domain-containing protein n=1 Tax=Pseudocercospora fuligena TaxID=685502 RepID=A0A8H6RFV9_9PEZI|nr:hypothetical protein HII31_07938 [Pseudocercospora fuligena]
MSTTGPQPTSPAAAAITAVFGTAELFEAILLQVDMLDVFRAQRVCKLWQLSTQGSKWLQRKMFALPDGSPISPILTQTSWSFYLNRDRDTLNPNTAEIVHRACEIALNPSTKALGWGGKQPSQHDGYQGSEHPTKRTHLFGHKERSLAHMHAHFIRHTVDHQVHHLSIIRMELLTQRLQRIWPATKDQHASWRKMLVTQPPFTTMELEARSKSSERYFPYAECQTRSDVPPTTPMV